ncbi:hypothetical protein [Halomonas stenophila]|uniref:Uncharacterized protein n=1 Tax=Halomonas stenophila TaxID=795312 RepID=A0A7W5N3D3_9GAMM|nr:hypothetical protein [Halomonas stenophila]MBB3233104.1 hypothetical protein [Halomonas stenophila]
MTSGKQYTHYTGLKWFRFLVGFGFVTNMLLFALPALFTPRLLESLLNVGTTNTIQWLQNVGILLVIISVMYIPAIRDPFRYLFISFLLVAGRFSAGCLFLIGVLFIDYPDGMMALALNDLILSSIQAVALYFMLRDGDPRVGGA